MTHAPAVLPDDPEILREMIVSLQTEVARLSASARAYEALVQSLKIRIARLQKQKFGASSEKIDREIEQLELLLEDVKIAIAAADPSPETSGSTMTAMVWSLPPDGAANQRFPTRHHGSVLFSTRARPVPPVAVPYASLAKMSPKYWTLLRKN